MALLARRCGVGLWGVVQNNKQPVSVAVCLAATAPAATHPRRAPGAWRGQPAPSPPAAARGCSVSPAAAAQPPAQLVSVGLLVRRAAMLDRRGWGRVEGGRGQLLDASGSSKLQRAPRPDKPLHAGGMVDGSYSVSSVGVITTRFALPRSTCRGQGGETHAALQTTTEHKHGTHHG